MYDVRKPAHRAGLLSPMTEMRSASNGIDFSDPLTRNQPEVLRRAVAKVLVFGEQVGVSSDEMICLLEGGLTVKQLLNYLVSRQKYPA